MAVNIEKATMSNTAMDSGLTSVPLTSTINLTESVDTGIATLPSANLNDIVPSGSTSVATIVDYSPVCRYFQRGMCRYGLCCRFLHEAPEKDTFNNAIVAPNVPAQEKPSTSRRNWVNAPVFVPRNLITANETLQTLQESAQDVEVAAPSLMSLNRSWAEVVGAGISSGRHDIRSNTSEIVPGSFDEICPYESPCPYGSCCAYALHLELCEMCNNFCLHPKDEAQRKKHKKECLQQHEQAMELSFAVARSKDKACGICFDTIMEKAGREKRFGILPNCNHVFCLECIRKWRQAKQFEHKITRSCPECRVSSDYVCPSAFWVETKEEKDKLLRDYRNALGATDCKYFKKGGGKCPFGNKCFYKHALPDGELVDVGRPKPGRKLHRSNNEIINLLDVYLYEFLEQRDFNFLDFLTNGTSDESDFGDDYDD